MSGGMFGSGAAEELSLETGVMFLGKASLRQEYIDPKQPAVLESDVIKNEFAIISQAVRDQVQKLS